MPILEILFQTLFVLLVVRLLSPTATLRARTLGLYFLVGALGGSLAAPGIARLLPAVNPLSAVGQALLLLAALLLPAGLVARRRSPLALADAFLAAFLVGFGFDAAAAWLVNSAASTLTVGFAFVPPGQLILGSDHVAAGFGYWCGLVALAVAAAARFLRTPPAVAGLGAIALLYSALECAAASSNFAQPSFLDTWGKITLQGSLTPWLALLLLLALQFLEARWLASRVAAAAKASLLDEWHDLLQKLVSADFAAYVRLRNSYSAARQLRLAAAEASSPRVAESLNARMAPPAASAPRSGPAALLTSLQTHPAAAAAWLLFFFVVLLLPRLPNSVSDFSWSVLAFPIPGLQLSVLNTALVMVLLWRYIAAPPRPADPHDPEARARFRALRVLLLAGVAAVLLTLIYVDIEDFYPFHRLIARNASMPGFETHRLLTLLLLFAVCATSYAAAARRLWRPAAPEERRQARLHNALRVVSYGAVALAGLEFFTRLMTWMHAKYGPSLYRNYAGNGNDVADMYGVLPAVVVCFLVAKLLFFLARHTEKLLLRKLTQE